MKSENIDDLNTPNRQPKLRTGVAGAVLAVTALAGGAVVGIAGNATAENPAVVTTETPSPTPSPDLNQINPNTNPNMHPDTVTPPASSPTPDLNQINPNYNPNMHPDTVKPPTQITSQKPATVPHAAQPTATATPSAEVSPSAIPTPSPTAVITPELPHNTAQEHDGGIDDLTIAGGTLALIGTGIAVEEIVRRRRQG